MRISRVLFLLAATAVLTGCEVQARGVPKRTPAPSAPRLDVVLPPLRGVVGIDESGSMATARVAPLTVASLAPIFDRLETSGGELAIAFITDQSNAPLSWGEGLTAIGRDQRSSICSERPHPGQTWVTGYELGALSGGSSSCSPPAARIACLTN